MRVRVRLFGHAAEVAARGELDVTIEADTVEAVMKAVRQQIPALEKVFQGGARLAVGTEYAEPQRRLREGEIVSVIPPVAGG